MSTRHVRELFNVRSHNPSFFAVQQTVASPHQLLDFCIPVNLHFPPPEMLTLVHEKLPEILRYYPDYAVVHQRHLGQITGLPAETLVPCNGSTEIITRLCQSAKTPIVTSVPTFSRWTDLPEELGAPLHFIQRRRDKQFRLEVQEIVEAVRRVNAATLVISNPNNPTGAWLTHTEIRRLVESLADLEAVIIDESFIDFSNLRSVACDVCNYPNLIVVKSLGKSLGWHGVRLGYAATEPGRAQTLRDSLPFWNINGLAAYVLKMVTEFRQLYRASFLQVAKDRDYMSEKLSGIPGLTIFPSKANFLFVELPASVSGKKLRDRLLVQHGIMVRECSNKIGSSEQYLRLAVQTNEAVDVLVAALSEELGFPAPQARKRES
jgi:histidinol-phosphate/aromatic aminotransferase/cobyric acid decarboxylase-like protein